MERRMLEVSHPRPQLDSQGDLIRTTRNLQLDLVPPDQDFCLQGGKLYVQKEVDVSLQQSEVEEKKNLLKEIKKNRVMNLEEKLQIYARELEERLDLKIPPSANKGSEDLDAKVPSMEVKKYWGSRSFPGFKRLQTWVKSILKPSYEDTKTEYSDSDAKDSDDDCNGHDVSFRKENEPKRTFTEETFQEGIHYAFYKTFFDKRIKRVKRVFSDPAIVFRMYLSRYLHSDQEREKAEKILNRPIKEKSKFCKIIRPFLKALQAGNADVTPTRKDMVRIFQGIEEPEEIVKMEEERKTRTKLRTGNLQECIKSWIDQPVYRELKSCQSLLDTSEEESMDFNLPDKDNSSDNPAETNEDCFKNELRCKNARSRKHKTGNTEYLNELDVDLQGKDIIILCRHNELHFIGKLRHDDIYDLIKAAKLYETGEVGYTEEQRLVVNELIPLLKELIEVRDKQNQNPGKSLEELGEVTSIEQVTKLVEGGFNPYCLDDECEGNNNDSSLEEIKDTETKSSSDDEYLILRERKNIFSVKRLRKYNFHRKVTKSCPRVVRYNSKFGIFINKKNKKLYTVPKFYKYGRWTKYSEEFINKFLKSQDIVNRKSDYIIQTGAFVLKGQEKVIKKCLASLKILGIDKKDLKLALVIYAKLQFKDYKESYTDELEERFKYSNDVWNRNLQITQIQDNITKNNCLSKESWLNKDPDYEMKTYISGDKKTEKRYEKFFNSKLNIENNKSEENGPDPLDKYRFYNYNIDQNFTNINDYSSEDGDRYENHFLDHLCSCGMAKEKHAPGGTPKAPAHTQVEYHYNQTEDEDLNQNQEKPNFIKVTGFKGSSKYSGKTRQMGQINYLSRESMLQLHSVFDHGLDHFNRDHVVEIIQFMSDVRKGEIPELVLSKTDQDYAYYQPGPPEPENSTQRMSTEAIQLTALEEGVQEELLKEAEDYLHTEYFPVEETQKPEKTDSSDLLLPINYLERVFRHVQQLP